ncbi:XRE family transcriptional regulator [Oceanobacillus piezotolerans]|uniref:XRE family transcriptional regulator n=1 Tax=Oceanobacillus piezotolerans TaxID=2448030 RepID=A0A498D9Q0_9BACI|nr:helix-turn-helix transcriptional regulator [Oceanobacillus piezotolerans]RLL43917.1 XRE family transcriptional regulator [Oceanobacillus piezotolerans]
MVNDLGLRLEKLADQFGYSKKEVSTMLGYSDNVFGLYVKGERTPNIETLIKLSEIFNVSLDKLITGVEYKQDEKEAAKVDKLNELLAIFQKVGITSPYILHLEKWQKLNAKQLKELTDHFEWVVEKARREAEDD